MKKRYILQNAIDKTYWYGHYTNKQWTDDILEAKLFHDKQEIKDFITLNKEDILLSMFLIKLEIYT
jgi:hypothetical protein